MIIRVFFNNSQEEAGKRMTKTKGNSQNISEKVEKTAAKEERQREYSRTSETLIKSVKAI